MSSFTSSGRCEDAACGRPLRGHVLSYLTSFRPVSVCPCPFRPTFIHKRNQRERERVRSVNEAFALLRSHLPPHATETRLSKLQTLRTAASYIRYLQGLVRPQGCGPRPPGDQDDESRSGGRDGLTPEPPGEDSRPSLGNSS